MIITLLRDTFTPAETLGKLLIDRVPLCDTLEPPTVPNPAHPKGCIPVGWYRLTVTQSPKFGRLLPVLHMVPGFEGIRIHAGNNRNHTAGCILVGELSETARATASPDAHYAPTLFHSKQTEQSLVALILKAQHNHEQIYIDITDTDHYSAERSALDRAFA